MSDTTFFKLELKEIEKSNEAFKKLLVSKGTNYGSLWKAWHYLQLYSIWGLHLPNTESDLNTLLDIDNPASFEFYPPMLDSYKQINSLSLNFTKNIFPEVVRIGYNILEFGEEVATDEDGFFTEVISKVGKKSEHEDLIDLIVDLRDQISTNISDAKKVGKKLTIYGTNLKTAQGSVNKTNEIIKRVQAENNIDISKLEGDENKVGSLLNLKKEMDLEKADYEHYKIVAATTAIYGWVPFVGIIMMGVYADKAVKSLKLYNDKQADYDNADRDLKTYLNIKKVQDLAQDGISSAKEYTDFAILQVEAVCEAWTGVSHNLDMILKKLEKMTTKINEKEKLRVKSQVKSLARACGKYWNDLMPAIRQLTENPYITNVETMPLGDAISKIDEIIANSKNQN